MKRFGYEKLGCVVSSRGHSFAMRVCGVRYQPLPVFGKESMRVGVLPCMLLPLSPYRWESISGDDPTYV